MQFNEIFGSAQWICAGEPEICPIFRKSFELENVPSQAELTILGFGGFVFFVNGQRTTEDLFLPLSSEFEPRLMPDDQVLSPRTYVYRYDVTPYLTKGKNTLAVMLGSGWYTKTSCVYAPYGGKKLAFLLKLADAQGETCILSDESVKYKASFVTVSVFEDGIECHDYTDWNHAMLTTDYDDSTWENAVLAKPLNTDYQFTSCPRDGVRASHKATLIREEENARVYDAGKNLSGYPVLRSKGAGKITVEFAEEKTLDSDIFRAPGYIQRLEFVVGKEPRILSPLFTWMGFRYFRVEGDAEVLRVDETYADVAVDSSFESSSEVLNWTYNAFLNTQLNNIHTGIPSDCPHLERRGYTGDGQLACRAAMACLDMKELYRKWIADISDCQDRKSGHVQYTAPYVQSGGGPGGWGCAIVVLPYEFWKFYGDDCYVREMYPQMLRYFDFMEAHSENLLVKVDMPTDAWCLGEWCTTDPVALPAPFVNNYFYVKSMEKVIEMARHLGKDEDIPMLEARIAERRHATEVAYKNPWDGNFIGCMQGANAFALDMGIGDERTKNHLIHYYEKKNPYYDTGIFGTDIVTRLLFEYGRPDIAYKLLTVDEPFGFGKWMKLGATTLWEAWYDRRSHNHPMFGAVLAYFFEYILGIRQKADSYGYRRITIDPVTIEGLTHAKGHITVEQGRIAVAYTTDDSYSYSYSYSDRNSDSGNRSLTVDIPSGVEADIHAPDGTTITVCGPAHVTV